MCRIMKWSNLKLFFIWDLAFSVMCSIEIVSMFSIAFDAEQTKAIQICFLLFLSILKVG